MDAEFRSELREANDRNWSKLRAELDAQSARLTAEFRTEITSGLAGVRGEISNLRVEMHQEFTKHLRWTLGFWVMTVLTIAGLKIL